MSPEELSRHQTFLRDFALRATHNCSKYRPCRKVLICEYCANRHAGSFVRNLKATGLEVGLDTFPIVTVMGLDGLHPIERLVEADRVRKIMAKFVQVHRVPNAMVMAIGKVNFAAHMHCFMARLNRKRFEKYARDRSPYRLNIEYMERGGSTLASFLGNVGGYVFQQNVVETLQYRPIGMRLITHSAHFKLGFPKPSPKPSYELDSYLERNCA